MPPKPTKPAAAGIYNRYDAGDQTDYTGLIPTDPNQRHSTYPSSSSSGSSIPLNPPPAPPPTSPQNQSSPHSHSQSQSSQLAPSPPPTFPTRHAPLESPPPRLENGWQPRESFPDQTGVDIAPTDTFPYYDASLLPNPAEDEPTRRHRIDRASLAMGLHRKEDFNPIRMRPNEPQQQWYTRWCDRRDALELAEEEHRVKITRGSGGYVHDYAEQWHSVKNNRKEHNQRMKRYALEYRRQYDEDNNRPRVDSPPAGSDDESSGDERYNAYPTTTLPTGPFQYVPPPDARILDPMPAQGQFPEGVRTNPPSDTCIPCSTRKKGPCDLWQCGWYPCTNCVKYRTESKCVNHKGRTKNPVDRRGVRFESTTASPGMGNAAASPVSGSVEASPPDDIMYRPRRKAPVNRRRRSASPRSERRGGSSSVNRDRSPLFGTGNTSPTSPEDNPFTFRRSPAKGTRVENLFGSPIDRRTNRRGDGGMNSGWTPRHPTPRLSATDMMGSGAPTVYRNPDGSMSYIYPAAQAQLSFSDQPAPRIATSAARPAPAPAAPVPAFPQWNDDYAIQELADQIGPREQYPPGRTDPWSDRCEPCYALKKGQGCDLAVTGYPCSPCVKNRRHDKCVNGAVKAQGKSIQYLNGPNSPPKDARKSLFVTVAEQTCYLAQRKPPQRVLTTAEAARVTSRNLNGKGPPTRPVQTGHADYTPCDRNSRTAAQVEADPSAGDESTPTDTSTDERGRRQTTNSKRAHSYSPSPEPAQSIRTNAPIGNHTSRSFGRSEAQQAHPQYAEDDDRSSRSGARPYFGSESDVSAYREPPQTGGRGKGRWVGTTLEDEQAEHEQNQSILNNTFIDDNDGRDDPPVTGLPRAPYVDPRIQERVARERAEALDADREAESQRRTRAATGRPFAEPEEDIYDDRPRRRRSRSPGREIQDQGPCFFCQHGTREYQDEPCDGRRPCQVCLSLGMAANCRTQGRRTGRAYRDRDPDNRPPTPDRDSNDGDEMDLDDMLGDPHGYHAALGPMINRKDYSAGAPTGAQFGSPSAEPAARLGFPENGHVNPAMLAVNGYQSPNTALRRHREAVRNLVDLGSLDLDDGPDEPESQFEDAMANGIAANSNYLGGDNGEIPEMFSPGGRYAAGGMFETVPAHWRSPHQIQYHGVLRLGPPDFTAIAPFSWDGSGIPGGTLSKALDGILRLGPVTDQDIRRKPPSTPWAMCEEYRWTGDQPCRIPRASPCQSLRHTAENPALVCHNCDDLMREVNDIELEDVYMRSKAYLCDVCATKITADAVRDPTLLNRRTCPCKCTIESTWLCGDDMELIFEGLGHDIADMDNWVDWVLNKHPGGVNYIPRGSPARPPYPCVGCFSDWADIDSGIWACKTCRRWVRE